MTSHRNNAGPVATEPEELGARGREELGGEEVESEAETVAPQINQAEDPSEAELKEATANRESEKANSKEVSRAVNGINKKVGQMALSLRAAFMFQGEEHENIGTWIKKLTKECDRQLVSPELYGRVLAQFITGNAEVLLDQDAENLGIDNDQWSVDLLLELLRGHYDTAEVR
jgi:hypothetical protein